MAEETIGLNTIPTTWGGNQNVGKYASNIAKVTATSNGTVVNFGAYGGNMDAAGTRPCSMIFFLYDSTGELMVRTAATLQDNTPRGTYYWREKLSYAKWYGNLGTEESANRTIVAGEDYYIGTYVGRPFNDSTNYSWESMKDGDYTIWSARHYFGTSSNVYYDGIDTDNMTEYMTRTFVINMTIEVSGPAGPSLVVEGITPGKIEQVSWSDVSDVQ